MIIDHLVAFVGMLILFCVIGGIGWWQLNAMRSLEHRIAAGDESLLSDGAYKVEHIMEAPEGSSVVQGTPLHQAK